MPFTNLRYIPHFSNNKYGLSVALQFTFAVIAKQVLSLGPEDVEFLEILHNFKTFMKGLVSLPINLPGTAYAKAIHVIINNISAISQ